MGKIAKEHIEDIIGLAPLQEGMLYYYLHNRESNLYFNQLSIELSGNLEFMAFVKSWQTVVDNNEMLRTTFRWEKISKPVQIILKKNDVQIESHDLSSAIPEEREKLFNEIKEKDKKARFNLAEVPFRLNLVKFDDNRHFIIISNHHIIYDGWSNGIILKEFFENYQNILNHRAPEVKIKNKYKEYLKSIQNASDSYKTYWSNYLKNFESKTILPFYNEDKNTGTTQIKNHKLFLSAEKFEKLKQRSEKEGTTLANIIYSAWGILLKKYSSLNNITFGTTISGRNLALKGVNDMVGLFINTIPLCLGFEKAETIADVFRSVSQNLKEREDYENTPLIKIVESVKGLGSAELFESILVIENYPIDKQLKDKSGCLQAKSFMIDETTNYKLTVSVLLGDSLEINLSYASSIMDDVVIENLGNHFLNMIDLCIENPQTTLNKIEFLPEKEKEQLLYTFNQAKKDYPKDKALHQLFEEQALKTPDAIAVYTENEKISYQELNNRSNELAQYLVKSGYKNELIGVMAERSIKMVTAILGILKSGNAYLPLDANHPEERNSKILKSSQAKLILTDLESLQFENLEIINLNNENIYLKDDSVKLPQVGSKELAYVIFTSGSTGEPKGVMVEHGNVVNFVHGMKDIVDIKTTETLLSLTTISFDIFGLELFVPISQGASVFLVDDNSLTDIHKLLSYVRNHNISVLQLTPSRLNIMLSEPLSEDIFKKIKTLLVGGEEFPATLHKKICNLTNNRIFNMYGPTETTIWSTCKNVSNYAELNIGKPVINTQTYILGSDLNILPVGIAGEFYISGDGVTRGYYNNSELTQSRFIENPFIDGQKMYKTGDLARWLPGGNIEFLGRIDNQVKIKGFRIELGEIESCLLNHERIKEATVTAQQDDSGNNFLCAFYIPVQKEQDIIKELKTYLSEKLPNYMIPSYFVEIDEMPLTPNGKINKKALSIDINIKNNFVPPSNELEKKLVQIWSEILDVDQKEIGTQSNFFELGGHSLKVTTLVSRIEKEFGVQLSVSDFFNYTSIKDLAELVDIDKWLNNDNKVSKEGMKKIRI